MRKLIISVIGILVCLLVATAWMHHRNPREAASVPAPAAGIGAPAADPAAEPAQARAPAAGASAAQPAPRAAAGNDYSRQFRDSTDLWTFAQGLLADAMQGDGAAQFYLFAALSECNSYYTMFFRQNAGNDPQRRLTVDEAMQAAVDRGGLSWQEIRAIHARCDRLMEPAGAPFGSADDWLRKAAENRYPLAQAQMAILKASETINDFQSARSKQARTEARQLAFEALRSKDPEVIERMAILGVVLAGPDQKAAAQHKWVWSLAACQRGHDCSARSAAYRLSCGTPTACEPYDTGLVDVIRRSAGDQFQEIQQRATEINQKIDDGHFDELGL